mmetsp:Transcript_51651/g.83796  ORF Transcript_51651/g.83796 Transcript_51651/m.83796 type:complete len:208 (+) Transcript_51651:279-902(+)
MRRPYAGRQGVSIGTHKLRPCQNGICCSLCVVVQRPEIHSDLPGSGGKDCIPSLLRPIVGRHADDPSIQPESTPISTTAGRSSSPGHESSKGHPAMSTDDALHTRREHVHVSLKLRTSRGGPNESTDLTGASMDNCQAAAGYCELDPSRKPGHPSFEVWAVLQFRHHVCVPVLTKSSTGTVFREATATIQASSADALLAISQEATHP